MRLYKLIRFGQPLPMLVVHRGQKFRQRFRQTKCFRPVAYLDVQLHHLGFIAQLLENLSSQGKSFEGL